ncbi:cytochrome P450 [Colletotrichum graminicola]|nr:cytochrome P450 [Colletotrichum graminicola]
MNIIVPQHIYFLVGLLCFAFLFLAFALYSWSLLRNYQAAKHLQIPIIITPVSWQQPLWMLLGETVGRPIQRLPLCRWSLYSRFGWQMYDKYRLHANLGPVFVIVSPADNEVVVSDPEVATRILHKWRQFPKSAIQTKVFEIFGPNVGTIWDDDWARHRKMVSVGFKESNYGLVWETTRRQTDKLVESWAKAGRQQKLASLEEITDAVSALALHVLVVAGFGKNGNNDKDHTYLTTAPGHKLSYIDCLKAILRNMIATSLLQSFTISDILLPKSLRLLKQANREFRAYMAERVEVERRDIAMRKTTSQSNLLSSLVSANEVSRSQGNSAIAKNKLFLSDSELRGNFFTFNLAGYETTSGVLSYAIPWLAVREDVQAWVYEETCAVLNGSLSYAESFPKLTRCLAVLYETLRLHHPLPAQPRYTNEESRVLTIRGAEIPVPKHTYVTISCTTLMTDPVLWGADSLEYNPFRWIRTAETDKGPREQIMEPPEGTFIPWSHGPRVCQGKKWSQVEFVAVIAFLVRNNRIEVARRNGESKLDAALRLKNILEDSYMNITPKIRCPREGGIICKKR